MYNEIKGKWAMKIIQSAFMWTCVVGTIAMIAAGAWFYIQYEKYSDDIKGKTILLANVQEKPQTSDLEKVSKWMEQYEPAFPNCRCTLAVNRAGSVEDMALLFCIGFATGEKACNTVRENLPPGVKTMESKASVLGRRAKVAFMVEHLTGTRIISPVTARKLKEPLVQQPSK